MKRYIIFFMSLFFLIFSSLSFADSEVNFTPSVTVRGVFTSFIFRNNILPQERDESVRYDLLEVRDPAFPLSRYPYGIVQLREPRGFRANDFCAQPDGHKITTYLCSLRGVNLVETYFSLIPTNTGAILIKNIATGKCLSSDVGGVGFPVLEKCILTPSPSDNIYRQLWFLAPVFAASGMSPLL
ncbi:hypothetical protein NAK90_005714 [Salmonella enterica]|uniref:Cytolethal distending toxin subunit A n=2 Tax=Salmonella enterica TaxID=28901 RepID=A0A750HPX0_SALER|nr:hypothetical protein [Salmonella enterica subsp. enterica serovar Muenchen]EBW6040396.1 hypothetical protein [Salmonella enterica subsp. enterica serovar Oranienburg]EDQ3993429.1 hypothetical protein [Salmonella enterica subsp. enterica]EDS8889776.1 hypothetical protein [Salmonella enterica]EHG9471092.1 hypothetical protein [Salmonella enterica subsp. enterica serovar Newport]